MYDTMNYHNVIWILHGPQKSSCNSWYIQPTMKWQVRILVIAIAASVSLILHSFISLKPETECAFNRYTNIQNRFIHQTLSPGLQYKTLSPEISSEDGGIGQPMNAFLSPYHKYYPVNCTALFIGTSLDRWSIRCKLVHKRNMNNGSFSVPSDAEVGNIFRNLLLELCLVYM